MATNYGYCCVGSTTVFDGSSSSAVPQCQTIYPGSTWSSTPCSGGGGGGSGGCPPGTCPCGPGGTGTSSEFIQDATSSLMKKMMKGSNFSSCAHADANHGSGGGGGSGGCCPCGGGSGNPTPTPYPTPSATPSPTPTPSPSGSPSTCKTPWGDYLAWDTTANCCKNQETQVCHTGATVPSGCCVNPNPSTSPSPSPTAAAVVCDPEMYAVNGVCQCPPNYITFTVSGKQVCRPPIPYYNGSTVKTDFFRDSDYYPVCGSKRIAVNANSSVLNISTNSTPNTTQTVTYPSSGGFAYPYARPGMNGQPEYYYSSGSRCACAYSNMGSEYTPTVPRSSATVNPISSIGNPPQQIIPPDTFTKISSKKSNNSVDYSPVAFAKNPENGAVDMTGGIDGRSGSSYLSCGCPNLNEKMVAVDPTSPGTPQGAYCKSALENDPNQVLVDFEPLIHDVAGASQVINRSREPQDAQGKIVSKVALPMSIGGVLTQPYKRRIWACTLGYVVDTSSNQPRCVFDPAMHQCSAVTGQAVSAVSEGVTGSGLAGRFENTVNKKMSCCLNAFTKGHQNFKFDCLDNSKITYSSFDQLWSSADDSEDGGQLNAIVLSNPAGNPISGFYTLSGTRCNEFSEFAGTINLARVNPKRMVSGQASTVTTGYEILGSLPLPIAPTYQTLKEKIKQNLPLGKTVPLSQDDALRCPILVRAAIKATCGKNPPLPAVPTTIQQTSAITARAINTNPKTRCTAAENISVNVQVRQVTEIAGQPLLKTFDSVVDPKTASNISVSGILNSNNGGACATGSKRVGNQCIQE